MTTVTEKILSSFIAVKSSLELGEQIKKIEEEKRKRQFKYLYLWGVTWEFQPWAPPADRAPLAWGPAQEARGKAGGRGPAGGRGYS